MPKEKLRILVVEDEQQFLDLATAMLHDYKCFTATTAAEAIEKFEAEQPDITFLDIALPDGTGHDVLTCIKGSNPKAFVVMLTGSNVKEDVVQSIKEGAADYIIKPFSRKKIKQCLEHFESFKLKQELEG